MSRIRPLAPCSLASLATVLAAFLAAALATFLAAPAPAQSRGDAIRYEINVTVQDNEIIETVDLYLRPDKLPKNLQLQLARSMKVQSAKWGTQDLRHRASGSRLFVDTSVLKVAEKGPAKITFQVRGKPHTKFSKRRGGYLRTCVTPQITYIRSQYHWYPRIGGDPATYRVTVDAKPEWLVRTAGVQAEPDKGKDRTRWTFTQDTPIGNIGLVAGPYENVSLKVGGSVLDALVFKRHRRGARPLLRVAKEAFDFYAGEFGEVKASRFTLVEMPAAYGRGSGYGESGYVLIGEGAFAAAGEAPWASSLVAHEVSHTWWGQQVRFTNFANESLACYATLKFLTQNQGPKAGRAERRRAVDLYLEAAGGGKDATMSKISGWGGGMDPTAYRVHAYEKGMMLLVMVERAVGEQKLKRALAQMFRDHRGKAVDYRTVRDAVAACDERARAILAEWDGPGVPRMELQHEVKRTSRGKLEVVGTLSQQGTSRPRPMAVDVVADCEGEKVTKTIWFHSANKEFRFEVPRQPAAVVLDPGYHCLAARPSVGPDPAAVINAAMRVVNSPRQDNPMILNGTLAQLDALLKGDPGKYEGVCYTGIGRCRFRMGQFKEARAAFAKALRLGAGGPFHRAWIYLRLGNMADLENDRAEARKNYTLATKQGMKYQAARRAAGYMEKKYPGYDRDK